ncbi:unnamed protein product [Acanthocheilonema viteae]|uniref:GBD/FH3 domain-containing protein n=1 Tax=Acanthocheilonema viteae TaxID=6277 RepID=A0A498SPQ9_ACAVI|nr:unnamed protein product [Acanthocheilonema viteae]
MSEIIDRKKQSSPEPHANSSTHRSAIRSQTLRSRPILRSSEIQNSAIVEAEAYRPCGAVTSDNSSTNIRLPLAVKPFRQYQLKSENSYTSEEFKCNNANTGTSSSLPRMSKTVLPSSRTLCKTFSGDFNQNSQNISSNDIIKSKCKSEISMKKFLHGINLNSPTNTTKCIARPIHYDNELNCRSCDIISPLQKTIAIHRTTELAKNFLPSANISNVPLASNNSRNSMVDIKWEVPKCNIKKESKYSATKNPTKSALKVIRPRRLTVACSTMNDNDWPITAKNITPEKNGINRKNIIDSDSLKHKTTRESSKKPWFSSSVDGPPIASQIRETAIDDDLPCKRLISSSRFYATNGSLSVPVQKPTVVKSANSQIFRMATTPPPKPTRTYEELLVDFLQEEKSERCSKSNIKSVWKICPTMGSGSSRMVSPKDCHNSRDHSSDSGFGADFRKSSSDTLESSPDVQTSGKWLQALDLPCDSYCLSDEDLMLSENSRIRRRNSLVIRTQTGLRVKTIIDKLLNSNGHDQRRALFSLKQIFQDDKDLVHEFVQNGGLECMIKLGRQADQNHQNYILRALGQVMLYVDGMNGIIAHIETIQWLYELLDSPNINPSLCSEMNLFRADWVRLDRPDWFALMRVLNEKDASDVEMLTYGMTVINKTLNGVSDQDTYYDLVDSLESQGLEDAMRHMLKLGHKDLKDQCKLYEKVLKQEDEAESSDESIVKMRMQTVPPVAVDRRTAIRRRHQESLARQQEHYNFHKINSINNNIEKFELPMKNAGNKIINDTNGIPNDTINDTPKVIPPWRRKVSEVKTEPKNNNTNISINTMNAQSPIKQSSISPINSVEKKLENNENVEVEEKPVRAPPPSFPSTLFSPTENKTIEFPEPIRKAPEPVIEDEDDSAAGGNAFAAQLRRHALKREQNAALFESKQDEAEIQWKKAAESFKSKPLIINDLDFSEFHKDEFEQDPLVMARLATIAQEKGLLPGVSGNGIASASERGPPPAPPLLPGAPGAPPPPPFLAPNCGPNQAGRDPSPVSPISKTGTLKLHWKPAQAELPPVPSLRNKGTFWHKLDLPQIDAKKLVQLFEQKTKEIPAVKRLNGEHRTQILQVLPLKRSQAINIGLTKLPPISVIPTAIMKFDSLVLNKEGIEKILTTMMPNPAEIEQIELKMAEHPDMPLGQAEQFLLKLSQIPCLLERLRLWVFTLDYKNCEKVRSLVLFFFQNFRKF